MANRHPVVAIVDDDPVVRESVQSLLAAFRFETEVYASGEEFIVAAPNSKATCLVLDVMLGDITGIELARHLLAIGFKRPIVFLSACKDFLARQQAAELGCVAFIDKPCNAHQLVSAVVAAAGTNPYLDR